MADAAEAGMSLEEEVDRLSKKLTRLMMLCGALLLVCVGLGYGVFSVYSGTAAGGAEATAEALATETLPEAQVGTIMQMPQSVVNLLGSNLHYIKLGIALELPSADEEFVNSRLALLQNEVLAVVTNRTQSQLRGETGQVQLQEELLVRFNHVLEGQAIISRVLFTEFAIQ